MNFYEIDIEGIISNIEESLGLYIRDDGVIIPNRNITLQQVIKTVELETIDDTDEVSSFVLFKILDELKEYGLI